MAEIKSAMEIALERAAALGAGEDDSRREASEQGRALARRLLEGGAEPPDLAGLEGTARRAAAETLLEALSGPQGLEALEGLKTLAAAGEAASAWSRLAEAMEARGAALAQVKRQLAAEQAAGLAACGIGGSAVHPNPAAHPHYDQRVTAFLADVDEGLKEAGEGLLGALGE